MQDSAKYLIHADIRASGVVERSDVVGAIFGQTEGLLGDDLDLRDLQESSKVGRIDVQIESEGGRSFGTVTIASGLDKVETAVLAAGLETIDRVGPCRAEFEVTELEDARAAKRRTIVERATDLLAEFEESTLSSTELVEEVRQNVRVEHITEYKGLPAGPRVANSDAIILVEGRADVLTLLQYGIKNAVAVEGTDVPDTIAELTHSRTVTAFLDGDRGGDLILKELAQVGAVDYVTFAPHGRSVEDLSRSEILSALRKKALYDEVEDHPSPHEYLTAGAAVESDASDDEADGDDGTDSADESEADHAETETAREDGSTDDKTTTEAVASPDGSAASGTDDAASAEATGSGQSSAVVEQPASDAGAVETEQQSEDEASTQSDAERADSATAEPSQREDAATAEPSQTDEARAGKPETLAGHVDAVIGEASGRVRLLDESLAVLEESAVDEAFERIEDAETVPATVVLDGKLSQRILDVAAQRGVDQVVAADTDEFVKQPTSVRVRAGSDF
ncbi:DNA primase DnaG [Salinibaculum rarum]|uniref:DNA primase DnaG n=1 Tax=Salinibaculum rarum TaxID=3058903 RepID=UPI00265E8989|nr:DNA primase DnaG [Salinibaculum sp. KK48]